MLSNKAMQNLFCCDTALVPGGMELISSAAVIKLCFGFGMRIVLTIH